MPRLLVGLGNPGGEYSATRHNAGFWLADAAAGRLGVSFDYKKKFDAEVAGYTALGGGGGFWIVKPQTFMNLSGAAVAAAARFFGAAAADILVAHDEVDLPPGVLRLKFGGGTAGHNGLADINRALGGGDYWRLRIGVGRGVGVLGDAVLRKPPAEEMEKISAAVDNFFAVWPQVAADDYQSAMQVLHSAEKAAAKKTATVTATATEN